MTGLCTITSNADLLYNALRVPLETPVDSMAFNRSMTGDGARLEAYLQGVLTDWPHTWPVLDAGRAH